MGYSPWGPKELDMTERLILSLFLFSECLIGKTPKKLFLSDSRIFFTKEVYEVLQRLSSCLDASKAWEPTKVTSLLTQVSFTPLFLAQNVLIEALKNVLFFL